MQKQASGYLSRYQGARKKGAIVRDETDILLPKSEITFLHYHDRWELGVCHAGYGMFLARGTAEMLLPGDAIFIPPGVHHYSKEIDGDCRCRFVYIDPNGAAALLGLRETSRLLRTAAECSRLVLPAVVRDAHSPDVKERIARIVDGTDDDALSALRFFELICMAAQAHTEKATDAPCADDAALAPAIGCMTLRYADPLTSSDLAALCHLSESQFRRRFRAAYHVSPHGYLNRIRCQIGAELLVRTEFTVAEVAFKVGYSDVSVFYRQFIKHYGRPPSKWRNP